jgi:small subunit ribosomal protein S13
MARVAGVDLPRNKRVEVGLTYIFGVGLATSQKILKEANIDKNKRVHELTDEEVAHLRNIIERDYKIEGNLRQEISMNIKRLMDISSYRGIRHKRSLPVRGQRTKTNARTRKGGHKRSIGIKKKKDEK